jgi:hypothetical protein
VPGDVVTAPAQAGDEGGGLIFEVTAVRGFRPERVRLRQLPAVPQA